MNRQRLSLTEGSIWKGMLLFALPVFVGNVFQQFYNAFDSWCVGNFIGENALAAVSSSGSLIFMMVSFFNGMSMGAGVIIARLYGARQYDAMRKAIHTAIAFGLVTGVTLTAVGVGLTPTILRWMGTPPEVLPQSISYFRWYFSGAIFIVMYNIFVGILHAVGDSRHPLYYLMFSTGVNIVLDLLFVAVLGYGVGSAAIATTISQGISALFCCIHLLRINAPYRISLKAVRFDKKKSFGYHPLWSPLRCAKLRDRPCQCGSAGQYQQLWQVRHGRLRCLCQAGRLLLPAYHVLYTGAVHFCGAKSGRAQARPCKEGCHLRNLLLLLAGRTDWCTLLSLCT